MVNSSSIVFKAIEWYGNNLQHRGAHHIVSRLRRLTKADIDAELTVKRGGLRWSLNPSDFVHQDVFWHGTKDMWDVRHLLRLLPADALIVDIGSNFGYYAIRLTHDLGPAARAIAFEPMPANHQRLSRNIALNGLEGRIKPLRLGLSRAAGEARMAARDQNSGSAQIRNGAIGGAAIALAALDGIWSDVAGNDARADLIKIDVEGHEIAALSGARGVIERSQPIVLLEVDPPRLAECGSSPSELQAFFDALGYRYFVARRERLEPVTLEAAPELVNVLCLHRQRHAGEIAYWQKVE